MVRTATFCYVNIVSSDGSELLSASQQSCPNFSVSRNRQTDADRQRQTDRQTDRQRQTDFQNNRTLIIYEMNINKVAMLSFDLQAEVVHQPLHITPYPGQHTIITKPNQINIHS